MACGYVSSEGNERRRTGARGWAHGGVPAYDSTTRTADLDGSFAADRASTRMIRIQTLPATDPTFVARVTDALARSSRTGVTDVAGSITASSEAELRRALSHVRAHYPDVWIRRQDPLASVDGVETWYVFRDDAIRPAERVPARRR